MRSVELIIQQKEQKVSNHLLPVGEYIVGRDPTCHITVPNVEVSRRHTRLTVLDDSLFVEDLGSANGTYLEGCRISKPTSFKLGQRLYVGSISLECRASDPLLYPGAAISIDVSFPENKYQTMRRLAEGGMGVIIQASDMHIRRQVAMKVMHGEKQADPDARRHFIEEAQVTGQLQHPNIVPVYELGMDEMDHIFYTMKFVKGVELCEVLEDLRQGRPSALAAYSLTHLLAIFQKVCDAVAYAHSKGVVHRDLKPGNIMIGEYGEVMVMDWGLALLMNRREDPQHVVHNAPAETPLVREVGDLSKSKTGPILGTPNYMSPEQAKGRIRKIDARSDIFSLGAILYSILTLNLPVEGRGTEEVLTKVIMGEIAPPLAYNPRRNWFQSLFGGKAETSPSIRLRHCPGEKIPESLSAVVMKAMAVRLEDRYRTVKELQQDIEAYQSGFITSAEEASLWKQLRFLIKRNKVEASMLAGGGAIIAVIVVGFMVQLIASEKRAVKMMERAVVSEQRALENEKRAKENERQLRESTAQVQASTQRAINSEKKVAESLGLLQENARLLYRNAEELAGRGQFDQALEKIAAAIKAFPDQPDFLFLQARILQCSLRMEEARDTFSRVLRLDAKHKVAQQNGDLCSEIMKRDPAKILLSAASINALYQGMADQNRRAEAELMKQLWQSRRSALCEKWKPILNGIGISPSKLNVDADGDLLALDLRKTGFQAFEKLKDFPVSKLMLGVSEWGNLSPLKGSTIRTLEFYADNLPAAQPVKDLEILRGFLLTGLSVANTPIKSIEPLKGMPLKKLDLSGCNEIAGLNPLVQCPELEQLILPPRYKDQQALLQGANRKLVITYAAGK